MKVTQVKWLFVGLFSISLLFPCQLWADEEAGRSAGADKQNSVKGTAKQTTYLGEDGHQYTIKEFSNQQEVDEYYAMESDEDSVMHYLNLFVFSVVRNVRDSKPLRLQTVSYSMLDSVSLTNKHISSIGDVSGNVPNFYIPNQGSARNTTLFVRGFGSVQGTDPVMGMNIDNVPCLNKNTYDADLVDIENVEVLRGPQGTQTGRNTMLGVTNVYTISPIDYQGTNVALDYSTANTVKLRASTYHKIKDSLGIAVAASYKHSDGFYTNEYDGSKADNSNAFNGRFRIVWNPRSRFKVDNVLTGGYLKENAFAYMPVDRYDHVQPVNYDGAGDYKRVHVSDGLVIQSKFDKFMFNSITGFQYLHDEANIDPDYTAASLVSQQEIQDDYTVSHEFAFRSLDDTEKKWNWKSGMFVFLKNNSADAPYTYHQDGMNQLFLGSINSALLSDSSMNVRLKQNELSIQNQFGMTTVGMALYHQSEIKLGNWEILAGLRLNYERTGIDYTNFGDLDYTHYTLADYERLYKYAYGSDRVTDKRILPKISVQYTPNKMSTFYAYLARGQKGGGFNRQLFNDLIQNKMLNEIVEKLEISDKNRYLDCDYSKQLAFKSEHSWNVELGGHVLMELNPDRNPYGKDYENAKLDISFALFHIACRDQQVMVFPNGKTIGSMIVNAEKSRSTGGEVSVNLRQKRFLLDLSYGLSLARFSDFEYDGVDYRGKTVPFSPANTVGLGVQYIQPFRTKLLDQLVFAFDWKGYGKTYWDIENLYSQQFYGLLNMSIAWQCRNFELKGWSKNLAGKQYISYSFSSLGCQYAQLGTPRQFGVSASYKFSHKKKEKE